MNTRFLKTINRLTPILVLVLSVAFASACSALAQSEQQSHSAPTSTKEQIDTTSADFEKIQSSLLRLDTVLAAQPKSLVHTSQQSMQPGQINPSMDRSTDSMMMGKGRMVKDDGKSCMGMMCKMKMQNMSVMGMAPKQNGATQTSVTTILPGAQDIMHLYHIGEAAFFLDQSELLNLSPSQQSQLLGIQSKWQNIQDTQTNRRNDLEQRLWVLTSEGKPEYGVIKDVINQIESANSAMRLEFIVLVGEAVSVLNPIQLEALKTLALSDTGRAQ